MVDYRLSLVWGFPLFIAFDCVADGRLQTLASVGTRAFRFLSFLIALHMVDYRLLLVWGFPCFIVFIRIV